ncbi:MAG: hypothetical protein HeimC3_24000 [Candidatus Heimdallarchaeota archaeon LC_3]|nr:MAG: hypothetical protein HeimC3_24000 [Candidatus Heimdallarchaeota archaeon LC_3]
MENILVKSITHLCNYLNNNNIDYVIVGGISVLAWGRARTTEGIVIIIDHEKLNISDFVDYLNKNYFSADESDFEGFIHKDHCTIFYKDGLFRIDIIGIYNLDNKISVNEAIDVEFYGIKIKIDSPESIIAHKLNFGSQQDIEDAYSVLIRNKEKINNKKLKNHAERLNVLNKLEKLLKSI